MLSDPLVTHSFEAALTEILGKHVLGALAFPVARVADHRDPHVTISRIFCKDALEAVRKTGEVHVSRETLLKDCGLYGKIFSLVLKVRTVKIAFILTWVEGGFGRVDVQALMLEARRCVNQFLAAILDVLVHGHGVLEVVLKVGLLGLFQQSTVVLLVELFLVH